ncbi:hypothetical protein [Acidovorax sp.]|uniref:hypothetical protein n=1 Tax=Acidovorax sp. TaxID=1872122 RepID=UPI0025C119DC|nr:hypothetical protein [Acidovorax sp.]
MAFAAIAGPIAGAVVGGLMGGDGGGGSQTQSKEPWEPARKPLINSLNTGQDLERYYQRNPFNRLQQQGYQNLFSDLDMFRNQLAPSMMGFANQMMQSDYRRGPRNSQMEAMQGGGGGYGGGMQTNMKQPMMMQPGSDGVYDTKPMGMGGGGLMGAMGQAGQMQRGDMSGGQSFGAGMPGGMASYDGQQGLLAAMGQGGPFPMPSGGSYGLLDFVEQNPFTSTTNGIPKLPDAEKPVEKTPDDLAREEWERRRISGEGYRGEGA